MKKGIFFSLIAFLYFSCSTMGQVVEMTGGTWGTDVMAESNGLTTMTLEKTHINLGKITKGTILDYTITFTNTGTENLVLQTVKPSCDCSTPKYSYDPVEPGKQGVIKVAYNTTEKSFGPAEGTITIVYNGIPNVEQVTFEAEIVSESTPLHNE